MNSSMTKWTTGLGALLLCLGFSDGTLAQQRPRNIIFIIGDGMGLHQVSAKKKLYFERTITVSHSHYCSGAIEAVE